MSLNSSPTLGNTSHSRKEPFKSKGTVSFFLASLLLKVDEIINTSSTPATQKEKQQLQV